MPPFVVELESAAEVDARRYCSSLLSILCRGEAGTARPLKFTSKYKSWPPRLHPPIELGKTAIRLSPLACLDLCDCYSFCFSSRLGVYLVGDVSAEKRHESTRITGCRPHPLSFTRGKADRNHWDRRVIQPNHIKFRTCIALAPM
jgi:hypothetical protein